MPRASVGLLGLLIAVTVGCLDLTIPGDLEVRCLGDVDCPGGQVCSVALGRCLVAAEYGNVCGDGALGGDEQCDDGAANDDAVADACRTTCRRAACGDGVVDSGEACDDGTANDDLLPDACRTDCTLPRCGDGVVDRGEACDDGAANDDVVAGACRTGCFLFFCGDSVIDPGEGCDDGPANDDQIPGSCRTTCVPARCGDGVRDPGEGCDDGLANDDTAANACRTRCVLPTCGDGVVDAREGCDNGPANDDAAADACRIRCARPTCGDGVIDTGEFCDDGAANSNTAADACRRSCVLPTCGDGARDNDEECDDGDRNDDRAADACRLACVRARCGDGVLDSGEGCDDGSENGSGADQCRTDCVAARCGDGIVDTGEDCDDGRGNSDVGASACRTDCRRSSCGDGVRDLGEACDQGAANSDVLADACRPGCVRPRCGDGVVDTGEGCDAGAANGTGPGQCRPDCRVARCGDGIVDVGEACDAGAANNDRAPNACRTTCQLPRCGDGTRDNDEHCDAGAANSDDRPDACRTTCTAARCGDGVLDRGEDCDDGTGNGTGAGQCRPDCEAPRCGDGIVDAHEDCDDGAANSDTRASACRTTCRLPRCGDGVRDVGEGCDRGTQNSDQRASACRTHCALSRCGDGVVDVGEQCDDGAGNSDTLADACRRTCVRAACGDGVADTGEACDHGPANSDVRGNACRRSCVLPLCGDGVIDVGEQCDDGPANSAFQPGACRPSCRRATCGDGIVDPGEQCDDAGDNGTGADQCRTSCLEPRCGDGIVDGGEQCDAGAANSDQRGNACRTTCVSPRCGDGVVDTGEQCDAGTRNDDRSPNACRTRCLRAACGDGVVDQGEVCDDGGTTSGDGCRGDCAKEEVCGDRIVDAGEQCDDGNQNPRDGCDECALQLWQRELLVSGSPEGRHARDNFLATPIDVSIDGLGRIYVVEAGRSQRIRRIDTNGEISTIAGDGWMWDPGDGSLASLVSTADAHGISVDAAGEVYFGSYFAKIKKIDRNRRLQTVAGTGSPGFSGDNGPAKKAQISDRPTDLHVMPDGSIYFADSGNCRVRLVDRNGDIRSVVGCGCSCGGSPGNSTLAADAQVGFIASLDVGRAGELVLADWSSWRVLQVDNSGSIRTIAGTNAVPAWSIPIRAVEHGDPVPPDGPCDLVDGGPATSGCIVPWKVRLQPDGAVVVGGNWMHAGRWVGGIGRIDSLGLWHTVTVDQFWPDGRNSEARGLALQGDSMLVTDGTLRYGSGVRRITADGTIEIVAGTGKPEQSGDGAFAQSFQFLGVSFDFNSENKLIALSKNQILIEETPGLFSLFADGSGGDGHYSVEDQVGFTSSSNLYIGDSSQSSQNLLLIDDNTFLVADWSRCQVLQVESNGQRVVIAGNGRCGKTEEGQFAIDTMLDRPVALVRRGDQDLIVADANGIKIVDEDGRIWSLLVRPGGGGSNEYVDYPLNGPRQLAVDLQGRVLFSEHLLGEYGSDLRSARSGARVMSVTTDGVLATIAGSGSAGFAGDGGPATSARLNRPQGIAVDSSGRILVADSANHRIRRIDLDGTIETVAGTGTAARHSTEGDFGAALSARLNTPQFLRFDQDERLVFTDSVEYSIRRIEADGTIKTIAGWMTPPGPGPRARAKLFYPSVLLTLSPDSLLAFSLHSFGGDLLDLSRETLEHVIGFAETAPVRHHLARSSPALTSTYGAVLDPVQRSVIITQWDGSLRTIGLDPDDDGRTNPVDEWTSARTTTGLLGLGGIAYDAGSDTFLVVQTAEHCVKRIQRNGTMIETFYGSCGIPGSLAGHLNSPRHVAISEASGAVYLSDYGNARVLRIENGQEDLVIGDGTKSGAGEGRPARSLPIDQPYQIALDGSGNLYIAASATVRMVANVDGDADADGDDHVFTIYGGGERAQFPESDSFCILGLALGADDAVIAADGCQGFAVRLTPRTSCAAGYLRETDRRCVDRCDPGRQDGGDGVCVANGTCSAQFHNGGDGRCLPAGRCITGFQDGGNGVCVPQGSCSGGFHDGGGGVCVATGTCRLGFHDGGNGRCVPSGSCAAGFHDGGYDVCVPIGTCRVGFHDGGDGLCVATGTCSDGFHDGGDGACTAVPGCFDGYHDGGDGRCVAVGSCRTGFHDGGDGACRPVGSCSAGFHDGGGGVCVAEGSCQTGFHDGGDGRCVASGTCSAGYVIVPTDLESASWSTVASLALNAAPAGAVVLDGAWLDQGPAVVGGRNAWRQQSDWNALYVPVARSSSSREAVAVDVYHPDTNSGLAVVVRGDRNGFNGAENYLEYSLQRNEQTVTRGGFYDGCCNSGGITQLARRTDRGIPVQRWVTVRVELDAGSGETRFLVDGEEMFRLTVDLTTLENVYVQLRSGTACCSVPADIGWTNLTVQSGGANGNASVGDPGTCVDSPP